MSDYIISADVATDNPTVIIRSFPFVGKDWIITMRGLERKHTIKRLFNKEKL